MRLPGASSRTKAGALLADLQHHQRNSLSVIRSIVRQTVERSTNPEEAIAHIEGRINTFARLPLRAAPLPGLNLHPSWPRNCGWPALARGTT